MTSSHRERHKAGYHASGTSRTVTFDEGTALDSTYLLVCIVHYTTSTAPTTPSGWTQVGSNPGVAPTLAVWLKQGDGSTNSITYTSANGVGSTHLIAYSGYESLTPLVAYATTQVVTAINPWTFADLATVTGYGVAINMAGSSAQAMAAVTATWTNSWSNLPTASTSARMVLADDDYIDGAGDQSTTVTLSATRAGWEAQIVLPLVTPAVTHDAAGVVDVVTASSGDLTAAFEVAGVAGVTIASSGEVSAGLDIAGVAGVVTDAVGDVSLRQGVSGAVAVSTTVSGDATIVPSGTIHVIEAVAWDYALLAGGG